LETSLSDSANEISSGIDTSSSGASQLLKSREGDQAKAIDQINTKANDVNLQARKAFVNNLEKMGGVDDDTLMVSKQLGTMIDGTQKGITDISASTMSHLDLSTRTMAKLNSQSAKNLATVADVMKTFTTVVVGFLNETSLTMESLTSDLSSVQNTSSVRLKQMEVRSADEHNWVESHLNEVSDRLKNLDAENDSNQNSFKSGLSTTESTLQHWRLEREKEIADFKDQLDQVRQNLIQTNNEQVNRVRDWIQKRNPKIAQQLLSAATSGAFIQTSPLLVEAQSRQSVVRELTGRIAHVKDDIRRLRKRRT
jgi:hypothetical protein